VRYDIYIYDIRRQRVKYNHGLLGCTATLCGWYQRFEGTDSLRPCGCVPQVPVHDVAHLPNSAVRNTITSLWITQTTSTVTHL
jgi:hypothetical protein